MGSVNPAATAVIRPCLWTPVAFRVSVDAPTSQSLRHGGAMDNSKSEQDGSDGVEELEPQTHLEADDAQVVKGGASREFNPKEVKWEGPDFDAIKRPQ
jgi:hypothetical protein